MVILGVWIMTLVPCAVFVYLQIKEDKIVREYIADHDLAGLPINKKSAVKVSDVIRAEFNVDESTFVHMKMAKRPLLRENAGALLTYKEGLCGEGARVIARLLQELGFDATRITLYNKKLRSTHTLVSVVNDGREFFVDSIRSANRVNSFFKENDISTKDFDLVRYSDKIENRRAYAGAKQGAVTESPMDAYSHRFWLYSYEAIPYSKFVTRLGLNVRVFNFQRPPRLVSRFAEKPNTIMATVCLVSSLVIVLLLHQTGLFPVAEASNLF